ncbi:MAG: amidohydrolase family protein [Bacilli bacterium]|nr:amidohydrolase family protein [Bacilli bacterium]
MEIYRGNIVYSLSSKELIELKRGYLVINEGKVIRASQELPKEFEGLAINDYGESLIIPSFSDLHVHAPQYPNRGIAMDLLLSDWLNEYTFPLEAKYKDKEFAEKVYRAFVDDLIKHGTMHASIYATIHNKANDILVDILEEKGLPSFIGKVNMDKDSPSFLIETTENSLHATEAFLKKHEGNRYAKPILTPRFAPTCSFELLEGLGKLAKKYHVGCQTHIVESLWEKEEAKKCYEGCACDMEIYKKAGLLEQKPFIAGHFIYPSEEDIAYLLEAKGYAITCPDATTNVIAGIMGIGKLLDKGINLGIGSDISAGSYLGIFRQVASAIRLSKIKTLYEKDNRVISIKEAFYMATKQSGAIFGKVGSFEEGYDFDALIIDGLQDDFRQISPAELLERFCYTGDASNIKHRFLRGKEI